MYVVCFQESRACLGSKVFPETQELLVLTVVVDHWEIPDLVEIPAVQVLLDLLASLVGLVSLDNQEQLDPRELPALWVQGVRLEIVAYLVLQVSVAVDEQIN